MLFLKYGIAGLGVALAAIDFMGWSNNLEATLNRLRIWAKKSSTKLSDKIDTFAASASTGVVLFTIIYCVQGLHNLNKSMDIDTRQYIAFGLAGLFVFSLFILIAVFLLWAVLHVLNMGPKGTVASIGLLFATIGVFV